MVGTISREVRARTVHQKAIWLFLSSSAIGGGALGYSVGLTGNTVQPVLPSALWYALMFVSVVLSYLVLAEVLALPHPHAFSRRRQVPPDAWTRYKPGFAAVLWGAELGLGMTTRAQSWAIWAMLTWVLLSGSAVGGMAAGLAFGGARGLQVPVAVLVQDPTGVAWRVTQRLVLRHRTSTQVES